MDEASELEHLSAVVSRLQSARLRAIFGAAIRSARAELAPAPSAALPVHPPSVEGAPGTALHRALSALGAATRLPSPRGPLSPAAALAVTVHAFVLARGLVCTG
jgi:hypothetical protein